MRYSLTNDSPCLLRGYSEVICRERDHGDLQIDDANEV